MKTKHGILPFLCDTPCRYMRVGLWRRLSTNELMLLNCGVGEDSWSSLDCKEIQPVHAKGDQSWVLLEDWCWSWNSNNLATSCEELTHLNRPWCCGRLTAEGEEGMIEDEMVGWHLMEMCLGGFRELVMDREAWRAARGLGNMWVYAEVSDGL